MKPHHLPLLFAAIALPVLPLQQAYAQRAPQGDLQQQMSPEEFAAAGLHKLDAAELRALDNWLQGRVEQATVSVRESAREEGRQEVIVKNRGFLSFGSSDPIQAGLEGEFRGFAKGRQYTLDNGQVWEQTDNASVSSVRKQAPRVRITPGLMNVWYLQIEGLNTRAKVQRIK